jgi:hypothetical protein
MPVFPEEPEGAFKTVVRAQPIFDGMGDEVLCFLGLRAMRL